jgi:hypothetical protein
VADRVAAYARSPESSLVVGWIDRIREEVRDRPLSTALTEERRAAWAPGWSAGRAAGEMMRWSWTLRGFVDRHSSGSPG